MTNDVNALNEMFGSGIVMVVSDILVLVFITGCMFWLDWRLALVAFTVLPFLLIVSFFFRIKAMEPVVGAGGCLVMPPRYMQGIRAICDKYDVARMG